MMMFNHEDFYMYVVTNPFAAFQVQQTKRTNVLAADDIEDRDIPTLLRSDIANRHQAPARTAENPLPGANQGSSDSNLINLSSHLLGGAPSIPAVPSRSPNNSPMLTSMVGLPTAMVASGYGGSNLGLSGNASMLQSLMASTVPQSYHVLEEFKHTNKQYVLNMCLCFGLLLYVILIFRHMLDFKKLHFALIFTLPLFLA